MNQSAGRQSAAPALITKGLWYLRRLSVMRPPELVHRTGQAATLVALRAHFHWGRAGSPAAAPELAFTRATSRQLPELDIDQHWIRAAAPALLSGSTGRPGLSWRWSQDAQIWHRAPDTGALWPRTFFGAIPYRPGNPYGDVRALWEPARLQHLLALALLADAGARRTRQRAIALLRAQLTSWVQENPPLAGPHYISSMECGLRLMAACYTLDTIRPWLEERDACRDAVARIAASHAPLIAKRLSLYSSRGNHTIAEAAALVHAGAIFTEFPQARTWLRNGLNLLAKEADFQILPDGGGVEAAIGYHTVNLQLIALTEQLLARFHLASDPRLAAAIARGTAFLQGMALPDGTLPDIGDNDDGQALSPALTLCRPAPRGPSPPLLQAYPESGYTVIHQPRAGGPLQLTLDHGPLGMSPAFGHGHADALSLLLTVGKTPVLVATGTYSYADDPQWRGYFRGTSAHNTVTVDGRDQAQQSGNFQWARPYNAALLEKHINDDGSGRLLATHDGYRDQGVRHARGLVWSPQGWVIILDLLTGSGDHDLALHWHLGVPAQKREEGELALAIPDAPARLSCTGGEISLHTGDTSPILGWRSPSYGVREPLTTLRVAYSGPLPHRMVTIFRFQGAAVTEPDMEECLQWMTESTR